MGKQLVWLVLAGVAQRAADATGKRSMISSLNSRLTVDLTRSFRFFSANFRRGGKAGYVYKLGLRNGKANVDEYSPIWLPQEFKSDGDKYEGNLLYWAATVAGVIGSGALAIYLTSAL